MIERLLILAASYFVKLNRDRRLSDSILSSERALAYSSAPFARVKRLLGDRRIAYLDVGARGGPLPFLERFEALLETTLCEPDPVERARLEDAGYQVIGALLGDHPGETELKLTRNPGNSSVLSPDGPMMGYYGGVTDRFDVVEEITLPIVPLDHVVRDRSGTPFDLVKLDTQGSEDSILAGGETARPLMWITEASTAQLYRDQSTIFQVGQRLYENGYVLFDLSLRRIRPRPDNKFRPPAVRAALGLPLHGDAYFMADWTRPAGQDLIRERPFVWAALMVLTGQEEILRAILAEGWLIEAADIAREIDR